MESLPPAYALPLQLLQWTWPVLAVVLGLLACIAGACLFMAAPLALIQVQRKTKYRETAFYETTVALTAVVFMPQTLLLLAHSHGPGRGLPDRDWMDWLTRL